MRASAILPSKPRAEPALRASRLRPIFYAVLVALVPTVAAAWAVGRNAADAARDEANADIAAEVQQAESIIGRALGNAEETAVKVARWPEVQRALVRRDRAELRTFARQHPNVSFRIRGVAVPAAPAARTPRRIAVVTLGPRTIGTVVVAVPAAKLLSQLRGELVLGSDDRVFLFERDTVGSQPRDVQIADEDYRAAATRFSPRLDAVVARPRALVDDEVGYRWLLVAAAALASLAMVALVAWAAAPLVARGRIVQRERTEALQVLSNVRDGVFLVDGGGTIRFWNRAAERLTGLTRQQVWGRPLAALPGFAGLEEKIPVGEEGAVRPRTFPVELGARELWLSIAGVSNDDGIVYTFADVTEEERLEQMKSDFLSTVSHELRTPLAGIYGAAVTLQERGERLPTAVRKELLETLSDQAEHLVHVVEDVLVASGLESDRLLLVRERFDAVALAEAVVEEARMRHSTHRVQLEEAEEVYALADPGRTRQVLDNLIDNAIKYAPRGLVRVAVERRDATVVFSVSDEGPGIPEAERERIFDKFYRSDVLMERGIGGTGLGLYICRELVDRMGGRLWLDSTPGAGSLFLFELPSVLAEGVPSLETWGEASSGSKSA